MNELREYNWGISTHSLHYSSLFTVIIYIQKPELARFLNIYYFDYFRREPDGLSSPLPFNVQMVLTGCE